MSKIPTRRVSSPFLIGLFVIISLLIAVGVIIFLGASEFFKEQNYYSTFFEGSVEGLDKGSSVKYLGVSAGSISKIRIAEDGRLVEIIMQIEKKIDVNDSLRVKSELSGLAGSRFLQLYYPENPEIMDMYPKPDFKPEYPMIRSAPSGLEEIEIAMKEVMNNMRSFDFGQVSADTKDFLQASTRLFKSDSLYMIMHNLQQATDRLNSLLTRADTSKTIDNIEQVSARLLETSRELHVFAENLNKELQMADFPGKAGEIITIFDSTMTNANSVISKVGYRSENLLFSIHQSLEELKSTNRLLRKSLREITDNPGQLFLTEPPESER